MADFEVAMVRPASFRDRPVRLDERLQSGRGGRPARSTEDETMTLQELGEKVGTRLGSSNWFEVELPRVKAFGEVTLEGAFSPREEQPAAEPGLHDVIAQGMLTLSLAISLVTPANPMPEGATGALNYGFDRVRFISPVEVGKRIRAHIDLAALEQLDANRWRGTFGLTVDIEGAQKPALHAQWLVIYLFPKAA
jgi:acyl dehydratase